MCSALLTVWGTSLGDIFVPPLDKGNYREMVHLRDGSLLHRLRGPGNDQMLRWEAPLPAIGLSSPPPSPPWPRQIRPKSTGVSPSHSLLWWFISLLPAALEGWFMSQPLPPVYSSLTHPPPERKQYLKERKVEDVGKWGSAGDFGPLYALHLEAEVPSPCISKAASPENSGTDPAGTDSDIDHYQTHSLCLGSHCSSHFSRTFQGMENSGIIHLSQ